MKTLLIVAHLVLLCSITVGCQQGEEATAVGDSAIRRDNKFCGLETQIPIFA